MMDDITLFEKRKQDMMKLWKDTFHDTDRYINLVFDTYFSLENSFVRYHENRLIAALLGIAYEFQILTKEGEKRNVMGLYLCGLATRPEWRRKGIMAQLMEEAEISAKTRGYDMTFLIPANDHLRHYYNLKGYETASWRELKKIVNSSASSEKPLPVSHIYSIKKFFDNGETGFLSQLAGWCSDIEFSRRVDTIVHSRKDFLAIMAENENSIFFTDTSFDPENPILAKVRGVVFPEVSQATEEPIKIVGLYIRSILVYEIRDLILRWFDRTELELLLPYSGKITHGGRSVQPYAMIKPLTENTHFLSENDNLMIEISLMLD